MGLKSELNLSREGFDKMLAVIGTLLLEGHILPKSMYEAQMGGRVGLLVLSNREMSEDSSQKF
jgi:hypothetical protein